MYKPDFKTDDMRNRDRMAIFNKPGEAPLLRKSNRQNSRLTLNKYSGPWDKETAKHLMNRTLFGYDKYSLGEFVDRGLDASIDQLLNFTSTVSPPVNNYNHISVDPDVASGETWIDAPRYNENNPEIVNYRVGSFKAWWAENIMKQDDTLEEKMLFFWHNILVTESWGVFFPQQSYRYVQILRRESLGDFRSMIKDITLNGAMLFYLNGVSNNRFAPDENYARELQELFTVGKGPGSQYTEDDVREAARILTGWAYNWDDDYFYFNINAHDQEVKQFSSFYGNRTIQGGADEAGAEAELDQLIDMILSTDECAKFLARRVYQFFVYHDIDAWVESNIINGLAETLRSNNYDIKPMMQQLLESEHFFDYVNRAAMIKTPIDIYVSATRGTGVDFRGPDPRNPRAVDRGQSLDENYDLYLGRMWDMSWQGIELGDPPNVAGFPPTYQSPSLDYLWINTTTVTRRKGLTDGLAWYGLWVSENFDAVMTNDWIAFFEQFEDPSDPNLLVGELIDNLITFPENRDQIAEFLKLILLNGQTQDFYWTVAWNNYVGEPDNEQYRNIVNYLLQIMMINFFELPDFQLL